MVIMVSYSQVVPYDSAGGRIEVKTFKGRETRSNLVIRKARPSDSGTYTCKPSIARAATIKVHILESKQKSIKVNLARLHIMKKFFDITPYFWRPKKFYGF